jgi:hypothetical protein
MRLAGPETEQHGRRGRGKAYEVNQYFRINKWSYEEFLEVYQPQDAATWRDIHGRTLLHLALHNGTPAHRVRIVDRLLDDRVDASAVALSEKINALHVLWGENRHEFALEAPLLERLLDAGADPNGLSPVWGTPLQVLAAKLKFSDAQLAPFYDVVFARPDLDLLGPGRRGHSPLQSARLLGQRRPDLVERMETYLTAHGQTVPPTD